MGATITTDQEDYAPWEIVTITGSGFEPYAPIALAIEWPDGFVDEFYGGFNVDGVFIWSSPTCPPDYYFGGANDSGGFTLVFGKEKYDGTYIVTATDAAGNTATKTFTDKTTKTVSVTTTVGGSVSVYNVTDATVVGTAPANATTDFEVPPGKTIRFTANPASGYSFAGWGGDLSGTTTPQQTGVGNDLTVTASFSDTSGPTAGTVNDGAGPGDIDSQSSTTTIIANWSGFSDAESGIAAYEWAIGTTSGGTDVQVFTSVGTALNATNSALLLSNGVTYFVTVRATNGVGLQVNATSDGVTVTGGGVPQYLVHYEVTGNDVPVAPPADELVNSGDPATGTFPLSVTNLAGDTHSFYVSDDRPATITGPTTITAIYDNEYLVDYAVTGNVVPVTVPPDEWVASGDPATGVFPLSVTNLAGDTHSFYVSDDRPGTITAPTTITATYGNEYLVHYAVTGNVVDVTPPDDEWVISGNPATGFFPSPVTNLAGDTRSVYVSDNRPGAITAPTTITATYDNEYLVHYAVTGNVVPVTPPDDEWVASGDPATGVFPSPVTNVAGDTRSVYVSDDRPLTITAPTTITATYKNQYLVTFDQTGLGGSATGLVVTYSIDGGLGVPISVGGLPTTDVWVDENSMVEYAYEILVASSTPGYQFWLYGVTGPASGFYANSAASVIGNYRELPKSAITSGGCPFDRDGDDGNGQQFRLIFTQDPTNIGTYKLTASNPGQFFYNIFYVGNPGDPATVSLSIDVPYPFVTQGAMPVHIYKNVIVDGECFIPEDGIGVLAAQPDNNPNYDIEVTVPDTGLVYVRIHLDYGLKKDVGYARDGSNNAEKPIGTDVIVDLDDYVFAVSGSMSDAVVIQNENVFKKIPGFGGMVLDGLGDPVYPANITITGPDGSTTVSTDGDGFYYLYYKHKGKEATFTVSCSGQSETVAMKANKFVEVSFTVP